jgi:cobalt/nickel transport system ATP-binding protein
LSENILTAKGVTFKYQDGTKALDNISIAIPGDGKIAVLGPNGAGKSTLFLHFNGILEPDDGSIMHWGNEVAYEKGGLEELRKKVGIVFEDPNSQLFSGSIFEEISFGPKNMGLSDEEIKRRVRRTMRITGIEDISNKPTHLLSHGQKKMVAIASIIAMQPEVIIFDEPTAGLDPVRADRILGFLEELRERGVTVIMSTHDVDLAYSWADYVFLLNEGEKLAEGRTDEVFREKDLIEEANLKSPWVLQIYNLLAKQGWVEENRIPGNKEELTGLIEEGNLKLT